ncbi:hypothetical protein F2Q70_00011093 [Brassica cretica]|uniref:PCI domain-containing protein n=1 Tax=Brassica cretica TaxID=69181 RepID=A0A8S9M3M4_BRACR|nr:hypothetical protein F2Q70_00011093 [Brassica cretica]
MAMQADKELTSNGKSPEKLKAAGSLLMKVFGVLAGKGPKRVVALYVTCQLFKTCFKLGTVNLCRSVIRSIETARIFDFEEFPRRDKVTYMYYTGRLEVFNENFPAADTKLSYKTLQPQKRTEYKVLKLSLGIIPKDELLQKYNLHEYMNVVQALRKGDLRLLRHALQEHEDRFLRSGVYLVLEKLELQVYQRLMKKIFIIQKLSDPARSHQLKLEVIAKALRWLEINMDLDELGTVNRSVIRSIETARIFDFEEFPRRDKVAYMYYTGRLEVFNENFPAADTKLSYTTLQPQKRTEYKYLIPVKLSLGIIPKDELLQNYNLHEYMNVVQALRKGDDLRLLRHALQEHEDRFLRSGVYLVLEKLELQVYQRLMKKIFIIQKPSDPARAHLLKLEVIAKALRWLEIDMDLGELSSTFPSLIHCF